jgi:hypothetical protein
MALIGWQVALGTIDGKKNETQPRACSSYLVEKILVLTPATLVIHFRIIPKCRVVAMWVVRALLAPDARPNAWLSTP